MAFSTFTVLYNHHFFLFLEHFHHHPKRKSPIKGSLSISPSSQPLAIINMLSTSMDLPILYNFIWIWNHTICGTLSLLLSLCMFLFLLFFKFKFIYFNWKLITLQYCIGFAIHQHESTTVTLYVFKTNLSSSIHLHFFL